MIANIVFHNIVPFGLSETLCNYIRPLALAFSQSGFTLCISTSTNKYI